MNKNPIEQAKLLIENAFGRNTKIDEYQKGIALKDKRVNELQSELRDTYDDLKERYPTLTNSTLLSLARRQSGDITDEIESIQREQQFDITMLNFEQQEASQFLRLAEKNIDNRITLAQQRYGVTL